MSVSGCSASVYFNPQGSREPRLKFADIPRLPSDFNPQGSREPRLSSFSVLRLRNPISIHKALASLDHEGIRKGLDIAISIHKALASLDGLFPSGNCGAMLFQSTRLSRASTYNPIYNYDRTEISIHKALASLDGKNAQLFLHLCHIYMLHIIHLLQIVYQVEISSRNLIVFSGQL